MNRRALVMLAAVAGSLPVLAAAFSTTHSIVFTGNLSSACRFNTTGPDTVTLTTGGGVWDPSAAGPAAGSVGITFRCSSGTSSSIAADNGQNWSGTSRRLKDAGTDYINYSVSMTGATQTGTGFGSGQDLTVTVAGSVAGTDYQNAPVGTYSDTVMLTISP